MRKADYRILAVAIRKHRDNALGAAALAQDNPTAAAREAGAAAAAEAIARTFARFAHVDAAAFLKACNLDP